MSGGYYKNEIFFAVTWFVALQTYGRTGRETKTDSICDFSALALVIFLSGKNLIQKFTKVSKFMENTAA